VHAGYDQRVPKRERIAHALQRLADRVDGQTRIALDYVPSAVSAPRYGWGRPPHPDLVRLLDQYRDDYAKAVNGLLPFVPDLAKISLDEQVDDPLFWRNGYCSGLDAASIYGFLRTLQPDTYLEIGSGFSTLFADRARRDGGASTRIVSIDPAPRTEVAAVCDVVVRRPLEQVDLSALPALHSGDIVFVDGSHRVFESSDVVVAFLELVPSLPTGITLGVDDVMLPFSYPPDWMDRFYSEQYLLAAYLLGGAGRLRPLLPNYYLSRYPLRKEQELWSRPPLNNVNPQGTAMWFVTQ
jgi:hypothetical protein